jgi:hypothetical protein
MRVDHGDVRVSMPQKRLADSDAVCVIVYPSAEGAGTNANQSDHRWQRNRGERLRVSHVERSEFAPGTVAYLSCLDWRRP